MIRPATTGAAGSRSTVGLGAGVGLGGLIAAAASLVVIALLTVLTIEESGDVRSARAEVARLQAQRADQQRRLAAMERETQELQRLNLQSERSIERIERTLGAQRAAPSPLHASSFGPPAGAVDRALGARLARLALESAATRDRARSLAGLARRVLNVRRLAAIVRSQMIAAIPSLNPVNGEIDAAFGWRTDPFPEFHKGLDLGADYGTVVHAAGAGTVASAGWEGGFGIKIDLDHGNGYHTWYCHLSRVAVSPGQHVGRGEPIGAVGSTGESTGPHLHYQVLHDGVAIDPMPFLNGIPKAVMATLPPAPGVQ